MRQMNLARGSNAAGNSSLTIAPRVMWVASAAALKPLALVGLGLLGAGNRAPRPS